MQVQATVFSSEYAEELGRAMNMLAEDERVIFLGQAIAYPGTSMSGTFKDIDKDRLLEVPVAEEMQMGLSIGLSLSGLIPVSIFTRWNFLLSATNQLVNHLDKIPLYSGYKPKVIVRTGIGSEKPMYPGLQHVGDMTSAFESLCHTVKFVTLDSVDKVLPAYKAALEDEGSTVLVEVSDKYNE